MASPLYFINGSLTNQFEFLQGQWDRTDTFVKSATGPGGSTDGSAVFNISGEGLFLGVNDPSDSSSTLPAWGAYCFLPSMTRLRYLAALGRSAVSRGGSRPMAGRPDGCPPSGAAVSERQQELE